MPACRNGRRGRLKICCGQPRAGSSPAAGINLILGKRCKSPQNPLFTRVCGLFYNGRIAKIILNSAPFLPLFCPLKSEELRIPDLLII